MRNSLRKICMCTIYACKYVGKMYANIVHRKKKEVNCTKNIYLTNL